MIVPDINNEYCSYLKTAKQLEIITNRKNKTLSYEGKNILERYIMATTNGDAGASDKMLGEIEDKKLGLGNPRQLVARIHAVMIPRVIAQDFTIERGDAITVITYGRFTREIPNARMDLLRVFASDTAIVCCALRYGALLAGSQQWSMPADVYQIMVRKYGVTLEAFASPFNSHILPYSTLEGVYDVQFCSLCPDVDAVFGSVGNFFDYDIAQMIARHSAIAVNPPYVFTILEKTAALCISICVRAHEQNRSVRLFITVPDWLDCDYYKSLESSEYLEYSIKKTKHTYYYEDSNINKNIVARFNTTMFILSVGEVDSIKSPRNDYEDISTAFNIPTGIRA